jgi:phenylacetic acid degradation operon negative regulatory protein
MNYLGGVAVSSRQAELTPQISIVCFAVGVAQARPGAPVAGPVLLKLLADLGISNSAARSLLLRMRREGWLASQRSGRQAHYRLAPVLSAAEDRLDRHIRGGRPTWNGSFTGVLFYVPERFRSYRDRLRRTAQLLGYVTLRPGLMIATTDRYDELVALLPAQPDDSELLRLTLAFSADDSRRMARQLWDLDGIAARCRMALATADLNMAAAEQDPPQGADALRAFAAATLPLFETTAKDPDLPDELLPQDWPAAQLGTALGRAFALFGPALIAYLGQHGIVKDLEALPG